VQRLSRRKEPENWEFRDRLKESDLKSDELDALVHELYRQESATFDCTACANCCKGISPLLDDEDIARLSLGLGIPADRVIAERIHALVTAHAPELLPRTWYGMPAYANPDGKLICFFKAAAKFDGRYAMLGFEDAATLDDGPMWPVVFAIVKWTPAVEKRVATLIKTAVG